LDLLYVPNGEGSSIGTIDLEISIAITLEALLSFQPFRRITSNPFTLIKGFVRCRGSVNLVVGGKFLGSTLGVNLMRGFRRIFYP